MSGDSVACCVSHWGVSESTTYEIMQKYYWFEDARNAEYVYAIIGICKCIYGMYMLLLLHASMYTCNAYAIVSLFQLSPTVLKLLFMITLSSTTDYVKTVSSMIYDLITFRQPVIIVSWLCHGVLSCF